jgi:hypothetical protein
VAPLALLGWIGFAFVWFAFRERENVVCHCWADDHHAWQYSGQLIVAAIGFTAGAVAITMLLRQAWRLFPESPTPSLRLPLAAGVIATAALAAWVPFLASGNGPWASPSPVGL